MKKKWENKQILEQKKETKIRTTKEDTYKKFLGIEASIKKYQKNRRRGMG